MKQPRYNRLRKYINFIVETRYPYKGGTHQISYAKYKGVLIYEHIKAKGLLGEVIIQYHLAGLHYPISTKINNSIITQWYEEDGFGHPMFENIEDMKYFIDNEMKELNNQQINLLME